MIWYIYVYVLCERIPQLSELAQMFPNLIQTNITFFPFLVNVFGPLEEIFATRYPFKWIFKCNGKEAYHW